MKSSQYISWYFDLIIRLSPAKSGEIENYDQIEKLDNFYVTPNPINNTSNQH